MMNTRVFSSELAFVSGTVEKKTTIPILSNVLIEQKRKACTITGTDLEISAVSAFRGDAGSIRTTVSSKILKDALKSIKDVEDFEVSNNQSDGSGLRGLRLQAGSFVTTLATISPESYPELPTLPEDGGIPLPYAQLAAMLTAARHAISQEESRFTLNGCLMDLTKDTLRVVGTDGHRLSIIEHPHESAGTLRFIVRNAMIPLVAKMGKAGNCLVCQHKEHEFFVMTPVEGVTRLLLQRHLEGNFPDYNRVLPKEFKYHATVNRKDFQRAVNQIIPMTDGRSRCGKVTIENTLSKSLVSIQSSVSDTGSSVTTVAAGIKGPRGTITVGLNLEYIIDAISAMKDCEEVVVCLTDPHLATEIDGTVDGMAMRSVIMPMRI